MAGGVLTILLSLVASPVQPQVTTPAPQRPLKTTQPLRVAVRLSKPDVFEENGKLVGFSVDLGQSVLAQMQKQAVLKTYADAPDILNAIRAGQADMGIAAIDISSQREQEFDFSYPILGGDLQIMVLAPSNQSRPIEQEIFRKMSDPNLLRLVGIIALMMLIPAHIVWYFERREGGVIDNPAYIPGIFQAIWWTVLALLGQAESMPKGPVGKVVGLFWVVVGIVFVAYFTAVVTAELTVQELEGSIHQLRDLENRPVAIIANQEAIDYLQDQNIRQITKFSEIEPAYQALLSGRVDAIIAPTPILHFFAFHYGKGNVQVVGTTFLDQFYAIALPKDSPYRKPINQAILKLKENGTYGQIYQKWFGNQP